MLELIRLTLELSRPTLGHFRPTLGRLDMHLAFVGRTSVILGQRLLSLDLLVVGQDSFESHVETRESAA